MLREKQIINAVEEYLKLRCYDSYLKKNLEEAFKRARQDEYYRVEMLKIINRFLFE